MLPSFVLLLLVGLAGSAQGQEPDKPKRPHRPDPSRPHEKVEQLVTLPPDFVQFARVPEGGIQPRLALEPDGLALLYFKGEDAGDLYLARSTDEARTFSAGVRVNATPDSVRTVDGQHAGALDVGPDGRAHVVWTSPGETPTAYYACEPAPGAAELEVVELGSLPGMSTPIAVAVEDSGKVYVFFFATGPVISAGFEPGKRVYMRTSTDGKTFTEPVAIDPEKFDVSDKSGLSAHVDEVMGTIFVLHRSAYAVRPDSESLARDMRLLSSEDHGQHFKSAYVGNWKQQRDPRTSAQLFQEPDTTIAAWDEGGSVFWARIRRNLNKINTPMGVKDVERAMWRSHACGASSPTEVILTWLEQPTEDGRLKDRNAPASVGWQVWFSDGRVPLGRGVAPESPGKSTPVVFARKGHGFTILF